MKNRAYFGLDLLLTASGSTTFEPFLRDAMNARTSVGLYRQTGIPWYLLTCATHAQKMIVNGARFAGSMQFIDDHWNVSLQAEYLRRAPRLLKRLERGYETLRQSLRGIVGDARADEIVAIASRFTTKVIRADNPARLVVTNIAAACNGLILVHE